MFLITRSFGSKGDSFGTSQKRGTSSMYNRLERIKELHRRLDMVIIENLSYEKVIEKYDTKKSRYTEVYNDINGDLVNFWKYVKQHPEAFVTELNQYLVSREMFDTFTQHEPKTELERAIRFYFQLSCSYGSRSKNFCIMQGYKYMPLRNLEKVKAASERLKQVIIEKQDFEKIIARFDTPNTFFYLDQPYYTKEHLYDREDADAFTKHEELAAALKNIKGKFLLSYNNDPYIRTLYQGFTIDEVEAQYTVSGSFQTETELLIRNYK